MTRLPVVSGRKICRVLEKIGFKLLVDRGKGSHFFLFHSERSVSITVPNHKEIKRGALKSILRTVELSNEQFVDLLP